MFAMPVFSIGLAGIYFILDTGSPVFYKFSNAAFIVSLINLAVAAWYFLTAHGAFRSIRYFGYKLNLMRLHFLKLERHGVSTEAEDYHTFIQKRYTKSKPYGFYAAIGTVSGSLALFFAWMH